MASNSVTDDKIFYLFNIYYSHYKEFIIIIIIFSSLFIFLSLYLNAGKK
jgi:hypothetical protein